MIRVPNYTKSESHEVGQDRTYNVGGLTLSGDKKRRFYGFPQFTYELRGKPMDINKAIRLADMAITENDLANKSLSLIEEYPKFIIKSAHDFGVHISLIHRDTLSVVNAYITLSVVEGENKPRTRIGIAQEILEYFLSRHFKHCFPVLDMNDDSNFMIESMMSRVIAHQIIKNNEWKKTRIGSISRKIYRFFKNGEFDRRNLRWKEKQVGRLIKKTVKLATEFGFSYEDVERMIHHDMAHKVIEK